MVEPLQYRWSYHIPVYCCIPVHATYLLILSSNITILCFISTQYSSYHSFPISLENPVISLEYVCNISLSLWSCAFSSMPQNSQLHSRLNQAEPTKWLLTKLVLEESSRVKNTGEDKFCSPLIKSWITWICNIKSWNIKHKRDEDEELLKTNLQTNKKIRISL